MYVKEKNRHGYDLCLWAHYSPSSELALLNTMFDADTRTIITTGQSVRALNEKSPGGVYKNA
jgi:hypothetical protein